MARKSFEEKTRLQAARERCVENGGHNYMPSGREPNSPMRCTKCDSVPPVQERRASKSAPSQVNLVSHERKDGKVVNILPFTLAGAPRSKEERQHAK